MINISIRKLDNGGSTKFKIVPSSFKVGGIDANGVDNIYVEIPNDWEDKTVTAHFLPSVRGAESFSIVLDKVSKIIEIKQYITQADGTLMFDAIGDDGYHAYSQNAMYSTYSHLDVSNGEEPEYTPSQIEQILAQMNGYTTATLSARDVAIANAEQTSADVVTTNVNVQTTTENVAESQRLLDSIDSKVESAIEDGKVVIDEYVEEKKQEISVEAKEQIIADAKAEIQPYVQTSVNTINSTKNGAIASVNSARDSAVSTINSSKTSALSEIGQSKTSTIGEINSAKTSALGDINTAKVGAIGEIDSQLDDLTEKIDSKMERYVIKLVKNADNTYKMTSIEDADLTFTEVYNITRKLNEYVVVVYGNSKLRPQYVSTNEMMFIGVDRSTESKILRILYTPTRLTYETFKLAESTELRSKADKSTTYTKTEVDTKVSGYVAKSAFSFDASTGTLTINLD